MLTQCTGVKVIVQHNKETIQPEHNNINLLECRLVIDLHSQLVAVVPSYFSLHCLNCNDLAKIPVSQTRIPHQDQDKMASISNITYSIQALRMIGSLAKSCYTQFHLPQTTRTNIIALGIQKAPRPYRRLQAGTNLFKTIHRRITQHNDDLMDRPPRPIQHSLLRSLGKEVLNKNRLVNLSLINAHSITSKVDQFQQELIELNVDMCGITETCLKHDDMAPMSKKSHHQDTKYYQPQGKPTKLEVELH